MNHATHYVELEALDEREADRAARSAENKGYGVANLPPVHLKANGDTACPPTCRWIRPHTSTASR
jgi:hypothetical protein